jgi:small subunit ribosomal protein S18
MKIQASERSSVSMKTPSPRPSNDSLLVHDVVFLRKFMTEQGKILSRRSTGISAKEQRKISKAIKHARLLGLLQFVHTR